jgi:hypothetical protein
MRSSSFIPLTVLLSACSGVAVAVALTYTDGRIAVGLIGVLVSWIAFSLWPWSVIPVGILGGTAAAVLAGETDVRSVVLMHMVPLAAGCMALATRRAFGLDRDQAPPPMPWLSLISLLATTVAGAIYGLAAGNEPGKVLVAIYQIGVIPAYLGIALYTLNTPTWRKKAAILYTAVITVLTAAEMFTPGRHGGLLSLLPVPLLIVCAGRTTGWRRSGLILIAAVLSADVVLASYRGVWVAGGIALAILVLRGARDVRRGLAAYCAAGLFLLVAFSTIGGLSGRLSVVSDALGRDAGYRVSETSVGWNVFASHPLFGAGLGQTTFDVYLRGFTVIDVGPEYHSFYIAILANLGLIGLAAVLWPIAIIVWPMVRLTRPRIDGIPLAFAALTCGFLVSAAAESPTDGHWELGLLPALTLLTLPARTVADRSNRSKPLMLVGARR